MNNDFNLNHMQLAWLEFLQNNKEEYERYAEIDSMTKQDAVDILKNISLNYSAKEFQAFHMAIEALEQNELKLAEHDKQVSINILNRLTKKWDEGYLEYPITGPIYRDCLWKLLTELELDQEEIRKIVYGDNN